MKTRRPRGSESRVTSKSVQRLEIFFEAHSWLIEIASEANQALKYVLLQEYVKECPSLYVVAGGQVKYFIGMGDSSYAEYENCTKTVETFLYR